MASVVCGNLKGLCYGWLVHFVYKANYASLFPRNLRNNLGMTKHSFQANQFPLPVIIKNGSHDKNELLKAVRLTSYQKPQLQSVSNLFKFLRPCFLLYLLCFMYLFVMF